MLKLWHHCCILVWEVKIFSQAFTVFSPFATSLDYYFHFRTWTKHFLFFCCFFLFSTWTRQWQCCTVAVSRRARIISLTIRPISLCTLEGKASGLHSSIVQIYTMDALEVIGKNIYICEFFSNISVGSFHAVSLNPSANRPVTCHWLKLPPLSPELISNIFFFFTYSSFFFLLLLFMHSVLSQSGRAARALSHWVMPLDCLDGWGWRCWRGRGFSPALGW